VGSTNLTVGDWYYIAVDNYHPSYRGAFTLCIDDAVDYDYYEGAIELTDITNWCSADAAYTTVGATPDLNAASCWNTSPNYNRWFKFQASGTEKVTFTIIRGGVYGNLRGINVALWESDGITQIACNRYAGTYDNVSIQQSGLTEGNWYYISVDNYHPSYRGSFSLCIDDGRVRWNGSVDNDWANAANWNGGFIPSAMDDIILESGLANYPETNSGIDANVKSLLLESGTKLTIPTGKALTVVNNVDLEADASGYASLIDNGTLNYDISKASYQSFLSDNQWHLISAPVSGAKSAVFTDIYLKYFTETDSSWTYITSLNHNLSIGQGFSAWASGALTGDATVNYTGAFNTGNQSPPAMTYNPGIGTGDGWNMIGNPFPSSIDWNTNWTTTNLDPTVYVYDGTSGQYFNWNRNTSLGTMGNGNIPPAQGFWVLANATGASMTIPHSERTHSTQAFYKNSEMNILELNVSGNNYSDRMIVHFAKGATSEFDSELDAYKLRGIDAAPQLYAIHDNAEYSMDVLPVNEDVIIPIGFEVGAEGVYSLNADKLSSFNSNVDIRLEDLKNNNFTDLREVSGYNFEASPIDEILRFKLHVSFKTEPFISETSKNNNIEIYSSNHTIFVQLPEDFNGNIEVYDLMGRMILAEKGVANSLNEFSITNKTGVFVVKAIDMNDVRSEKVFIK